MSVPELTLIDPQRLMDEVSERASFHDGDVWLVLVRDPGGAQKVLDVRRLPVPDAFDREHERELSTLLRETMWSLPIPPWSREVRTVGVTVLVRRGSNVWGPNESFWARAWRYSNHNSDAMDTDFITVTEHGWASLWLEEGGAMPRLVA